MPLLTDERWLGWLGRSITNACLTYRFALWAYVFMPDHVHLVIKPRCEILDMRPFLKSVQNPVSKRIDEHLRQNPTPVLDDLLVPSGKGEAVFRFWQSDVGGDAYVWSMEEAVEKAEQCHRNPVKRGLVKTPEQWRWSSYRWLERNPRRDEPLRVDTWEV
jgi:putative transposase